MEKAFDVGNLPSLNSYIPVCLSAFKNIIGHKNGMNFSDLFTYSIVKAVNVVKTSSGRNVIAFEFNNL